MQTINAAACKDFIYKSSQIPAIRNMFDSCHQAFIFCNSPKRQKSMDCVRQGGLKGMQLLTQF